MDSNDINWPSKTREMHNHHIDSTVWNEFEYREGDVVIASWPKSGSTWLQQLVGQILHNGAAGLDLGMLSPWLDLRVPPAPVKLGGLREQTSRRFMKTHLPVDAFVYSNQAKYLYIGRDGRDVVWSLYNHHCRANETWYSMLNHTPGLQGPPMPRPASTVNEYFKSWLDGDGYPLWPFWKSVRSWWEIRNLPNIYFTHFSRLKQDFLGEAKKIAAFLGEPVESLNWDRISEHCTFHHMKQNAGDVAPLGGALWEGGAKTFIHKGTNGRWRDILSAEEVERYESTARRELGDACANWLASGEVE